MYIKKLDNCNVGPIERIRIQTRLKVGNPIPIIIVGKNGSGKSILLSNIVDSFYEVANKAYDNVTRATSKGYEYYKVISTNQIKIGKDFMIANIELDHNSKKYNYIFKSGKISKQKYKDEYNSNFDANISWDEENNFKNIEIDEKIVEDVFSKETICYFGPNRYDTPPWINNRTCDEEETDMHITEKKEKFTRHLYNDIEVKNSTNNTIQWICDIIADSRVDLVKTNNDYKILFPSPKDHDILMIPKENIEKIMSAILNREVFFRMNYRSSSEKRLQICDAKTNKVVCYGLKSLSTGQLVLFNMFATIIRYADNNDINNCSRIDEIKGIVVVDEIDLHLHAQLQREVLPKLIKMFPKIQFIISTHSPLFLLGMQEEFSDNFDIFDMPNGQKISPEQFSEFENAYQYIKNTSKYQDEIRKIIEGKINKDNDTPLIITEGSTDWKHIKTAFEHLKQQEGSGEWLINMDIDFLEYEPKNSNIEDAIKIDMGTNIRTMCYEYSLMRQRRKLIFIVDADNKDVVKCMKGEGAYKNWGNNVFSIVLPVPEFRKETPEVCIEHYYQDETIETKINVEGIERRLFLANEFEDDGISLDRKLYCNKRNMCGQGKIRNIDGHLDDCKVYKIEDSNKTNLALSKSKFAEEMLMNNPVFKNVDFSSFVELLRIIYNISKENI